MSMTDDAKEKMQAPDHQGACTEARCIDEAGLNRPVYNVSARFIEPATVRNHPDDR